MVALGTCLPLLTPVTEAELKYWWDTTLRSVTVDWFRAQDYNLQGSFYLLFGSIQSHLVSTQKESFCKNSLQGQFPAVCEESRGWLSVCIPVNHVLFIYTK